MIRCYNCGTKVDNSDSYVNRVKDTTYDMCAKCSANLQKIVEDGFQE